MLACLSGSEESKKLMRLEITGVRGCEDPRRGSAARFSRTAGIGLFAADAGGLVITGIAFFVLAWERLRRDR